MVVLGVSRRKPIEITREKTFDLKVLGSNPSRASIYFMPKGDMAGQDVTRIQKNIPRCRFGEPARMVANRLGERFGNRTFWRIFRE